MNTSPVENKEESDDLDLNANLSFEEAAADQHSTPNTPSLPPKTFGNILGPLDCEESNDEEQRGNLPLSLLQEVPIERPESLKAEVFVEAERTINSLLRKVAEREHKLSGKTGNPLADARIEFSEISKPHLTPSLQVNGNFLPTATQLRNEIDTIVHDNSIVERISRAYMVHFSEEKILEIQNYFLIQNTRIRLLRKAGYRN